MNQHSTFDGRQENAPTDEDVYADALLHYWAAVKDAERTIAPFFGDGTSLTTEQRGIVAGAVADVRAAEDAYFAALQLAGRQPPTSFASPHADP